MTKFELKDRNSLIIVNVKLTANERTAFFKLALDTGCSQTTLRPGVMLALSFKTTDALRKVNVTTGTRTESAFEYEFSEMITLGWKIEHVRLIAKELPQSLPFDRLLGLDFFRIIKKKLTIDFENQKLVLE
ncbi:MAG: retropepsin-like domain-containing protein [Cytophagaceae bacterium]|nr:retropepsin-like domain-containing protein [Cytophagaceae bacterium]